MLIFLTKLLLNGMVLIPFLVAFGNAGLAQAMIAAVILSAIAYVVGDRLILKRTNNAVATVADVGLVYLFVWIVGSALSWSLSGTELLIISLAVGFVEIFFHMLVLSVMKEAA